MPPEPRDLGHPHEWLRRAHSNLARARAGRISEAVLYEDTCFDAQQAAEKAIKAVLVLRGIAFPRTHAIERLLGLAAEQGVAIPEEIRRASILTVYATFARYPGPAEDVTAEQHDEALALAEAVIIWSESLLAGNREQS